MKAVEIESMLAKEARERQKESTAKAGAASGAKRTGNAVEILPPRSVAGKARDQAAKMTVTNGRYVSDAIENTTLTQENEQVIEETAAKAMK